MGLNYTTFPEPGYLVAQVRRALELEVVRRLQHVAGKLGDELGPVRGFVRTAICRSSAERRALGRAARPEDVRALVDLALH